MLRNKYGELRSGWALALVLAVTYGFQFILGILVGIALLVAILMTGNSDTEAALAALTGSPLLQIAANFITILLVLLLFRLLYRLPFSSMGLSRSNRLRELLQGGLMGIVLMTATFLILLAGGQAVVTDFTIGQVASGNWWLSMLMFIFVAVGEELLSRGFMMTALKTTRNRAVVIFLPSLVFSLLHGLNPNVTALSLFNLFLAGVLFSVLFWRTGRLWMPIGLHFTWNFFQGPIFGMNVSGLTTPALLVTQFTGYDWLTGGAFGPEGGLVNTVVDLFAIAFCYFILKTPDRDCWTMEGDLPLIRRPKPQQGFAGD